MSESSACWPADLQAVNSAMVMALILAVSLGRTAQSQVAEADWVMARVK